MASLWEKEGESGLLDNFEFTITRSWFGSNEKYSQQSGRDDALLQWEGTTNSLDVPTWSGWFSTGSGWVTKDGGLSIVHDSGDPEKFFNKSTQYYKVLARCRDEFQIVSLLEGRGDPFHANVWVGLKFRMRSEEQPKVRGQEVKPKVMPVEFLGVVGDSPAAGGVSPQEKMAALKAERQAAAAAEAAAHGATAPSNGNGAATLRDQVIAVLGQHDDFDLAQAAAVDIPGVMDDADLVNELMDPAGLFAQVKAGQAS